MSLWTVPLLPLLAGLALAAVGDRVPATRRRRVVGVIGGVVLVGALALAVWAVVTSPVVAYEVGAGLTVALRADPAAGAFAVLVVVVTGSVVVWAAAHEAVASLGRLLGLLVAFAGAMLLVVLADDLLALTVGWELVGTLSWALIGHHWRDAEAPAAAAHAYNATRLGGMGLIVAAGATFAQTGELTWAALGQLEGGGLSAAVAGVVIAAVSKSALVPFSPWLFSAMAGPAAVSALLHSSTMVAAGVWALVRLQPAAADVAWFAPVVIAIGLVTALAGGVVALLQRHAKKLLAASTSAQYGLMAVAVGAGYPVVAVVHLVAHALFKAQLFQSAGVAMEAVGSGDLTRMRLGGHLRATAWLTAIASLALAAVPPLGAAFSKEQVLAAGTHAGLWIGLLVAVAGGLSAAYAMRYQVLAFGSDPVERPSPRHLVARPDRVEVAAMGVLAAATIGLGVLWLPAVSAAVTARLAATLPSAQPWELPTSLGLVVLGGYLVWARDRAGALGHVPLGSRQRALAAWLGLPTASRALVADPVLALSRVLARLDDRVVDAGVDAVGRMTTWVSTHASHRDDDIVDAAVAAVARTTTTLADVGARAGEAFVDGTVEGLAWGVDRLGRDARRTQTGLVHHQYVVIGIGLVVAVAAAILGR